jgi:outer membrane protein insertion porin family
LVWGAGYSTGYGVQGRIQLEKRNFDWKRLPSSLSPVTWVDELLSNKAFHGAGQDLRLVLAPGTQITTARASFYEPDLFGDHIDTIGLRLEAFRNRRLIDSYTWDGLGAFVGLDRSLTEYFRVGIGARQETIQVEDIAPDAPALVWDAEGQTEVRSLQAWMSLTDVDHFLLPTNGYDLRLTAEVAGGLLGAEEDFYKISLSADLYHTLHRDSLDRPHVLAVRQSFDYGHAYGRSDDLFVSERLYMGGSNLRGFDQWGAGPTQFGRPLGGEVRYLSRLEYQFPMVSTRLESSIREVELLRGVVFSDAGLLGTSISDPSFGELRLSVGLGVRIHVPVLGVPIALDFGYPLLYESTDDRRVFFFSLSTR